MTWDLHITFADTNEMVFCTFAAMELDGLEWVQGGPVELEQGVVTVVEFWVSILEIASLSSTVFHRALSCSFTGYLVPTLPHKHPSLGQTLQAIQKIWYS